MTQQAKTQLPAPTQARNIADDVLANVLTMLENKTLHLPPNYSPENAMKAAYFKLQEVQNKDKEYIFKDGVLDTTKCTQNSIANALLKMVTKGWDVSKTQCYFIVRGKTLCLDPSYFGNLALAKRAGLDDYAPHIIYEGDEFAYEISPTTKRKSLVKHVQKFENIDNNKIKGAYILFSVNGRDDMEIMNMAQIRKAWEMGPQKGGGDVHKNFPDQMAIKSVINRMCKMITNTSDDSSLQIDDEETTTIVDATHTEMAEEANQETLSLEESKTEPLQKVEKPEPEEAKTEVKTEKDEQIKAGF